MFIEQLTKDDYNLLAFLLTKNYDKTQNVTIFNKDTVKLTIKEYRETEKYEFYIQDFKIVPASKLAAESFILSNLEENFYKYMKQKFGYTYEFELNHYLNHTHLNITEALYQ